MEYIQEQYRRLADLQEHADKSYSSADYASALKAYQSLSCIKGIAPYEERLKICHKNLNPHYCEESKYKVTVIIPTFNSAQYVERAIESVLMQSLKEVEIICYDDGSSDETRFLLHAMRYKYKNIRIFYDKTNVGQGLRRNQALSYAQGEYITFLDSDDFYDNPYYFEILYNECVKNNYDIIIAPYMRLKGGKKIKDRFEEAVYSGKEAAEKFISRDFATHAPGAKFYRRAIAENSSFVEYGFSQDVMYSFKAMLMARKVKTKLKFGYIYFNDNISCWRPKVLTLKHFYSSLRVLAEVVVFNLFLQVYGTHIKLDSFTKKWMKDHGSRLKRFLESGEEKEQIEAILEKMAFIKPFLLELLDEIIDTRFLYAKAKQDVSCVLPIDEYISNQKKIFYDDILKIGDEGNNKVTIYADSLSYGGLERVATQIGNILSKKYDITYILNKTDDISYKINGNIIKNNIFDYKVLNAFHKAKFIFDLKWKNCRKEDPTCMYAIQNFPNNYIATIHNTDTCHQYFQKIKDYLQGQNMSALRNILCVSRQVQDSMEKRYGKSDNMGILYNCLDFETIQDNKVQINIYGDYILFAGRVNAERHKGIDLLLRAFAISSLRGKCRLLFAGNGEFDDKIMHIIDYYGLDKEIIPLGFVSDIYSLMKNALFLVAPSRWEGFGLSLCESLACGTPVLSTSVGVAEEVIMHKKNGYLCSANNVLEIARGMEYLYENRLKLRKNCNFSPDWLSFDFYKEKLTRLLEQ